MTKIHNLIPRLIHHNEDQAEYYQRQLASTERELGRLMIIDSGQMMLWDDLAVTMGEDEQKTGEEA